MKEQKKLGLSLSGGGARAMCYLGSMMAWQEAGIRIDYVLAHSGAALLLSLVDSSLDISKILRNFSDFSFQKFMVLNPLKNKGFASPIRMAEWINIRNEDASFNDLPWKSAFVLSEFKNYQAPTRVVVNKGKLAESAITSLSIPPILPFQEKNGVLYGDGGLVSLYSADVLRDMGAETVIGLFPDAVQYTKMPALLHYQAQMIKGLNARWGKYELLEHPVDLEVKDFPCTVGLYDFARADEAFYAGYKKGKETLEQVQRLVCKK